MQEYMQQAICEHAALCHVCPGAIIECLVEVLHSPICLGVVQCCVNMTNSFVGQIGCENFQEELGSKVILQSVYNHPGLD